MKLLILRFSSIGDIVLTTPVMRCLKKQLPQVEIHFFTKKRFGFLLSANPYIDQLHLLDDNLSTLIPLLKQEQFDFIIDLHHNQRTWLIKKRLGVKSVSFNKLNIEKAMMVYLKKNRLPDVHIVDRYLETVEHLGVKNDGNGLDYFIPENTTIELLKIPFSKYIVFAIGGQHSTKRMPNEKIKNVIEKSQYPIVLLGGKEDVENGKVISENFEETKVLNFCGKTTLHESALIIEGAHWVITHDTGMMHIAAALGKPIVAIWGNTIPAFGMTPYPKNEKQSIKNIEVRNLDCRPCSKLGHAKCPKKHFRCMNQIEVNEVLQNIL